MSKQEVNPGLTRKSKLSPFIKCLSYVLHFMGGMFACFHSLIQFLLGNNEVLGPALQMDHPTLSGIIYLCITAMHVWGIIQLCENAEKRHTREEMLARKVAEFHANPSSFDLPRWQRWRYNWLRIYFHFFGPDGIIGRRGHLVEIKLWLHVLMEMVSQTSKAIEISNGLSHPGYSLAYAIVLAMDCIGVSLVLSCLTSLSPLKRTNIVLWMDLLSDTLYGILLPCSLLAAPAMELVKENEVLVDRTFTLKVLVTFKLFVGSSFMSVLSSAIPLASMAIMIQTIHENQCDMMHGQRTTYQINTLLEDSASQHIDAECNTGKKSVKDAHSLIPIIPNTCRSRVTRILKLNQERRPQKIGATLMTFWGVTVLVLAMRASLSSPCASLSSNGICEIETHPWFPEGDKCRCQAIMLRFENNQHLSIYDSVPKQREYLESLFSNVVVDDSVLMVRIFDLRLASLPRSFFRLEKLLIVEVYEAHHLETLGTKSLSEMFPQLVVLILKAPKMEAIPNTFRSLPPNMRTMHLEISLNELPSWMDEWTSLRWLYLYNTNTIHDLHIDRLMSLTKLQILAMWGWRRLVLPPDINKLTNLITLGIMNNSIDHLPDALAQMPNLQRVLLSGNAIDQQTLPWTIEELNDHTGASGHHTYIDLAGNPICDLDHRNNASSVNGSKSLNYADTKACNADHCAILCPDGLRNIRNICVSHCNTAACDWHNGYCLVFEEFGRDGLLYYNETHPSKTTQQEQ